MLCTSQRQRWLHCDHGYCILLELDPVPPLSLAANLFQVYGETLMHMWSGPNDVEVNLEATKPFRLTQPGSNFHSSELPLLSLASSSYKTSVTAALHLTMHSSDEWMCEQWTDFTPLHGQNRRNDYSQEEVFPRTRAHDCCIKTDLESRTFIWTANTEEKLQTKFKSCWTFKTCLLTIELPVKAMMGA